MESTNPIKKGQIEDYISDSTLLEFAKYKLIGDGEVTSNQISVTLNEVLYLIDNNLLVVGSTYKITGVHKELFDDGSGVVTKIFNNNIIVENGGSGFIDGDFFDVLLTGSVSGATVYANIEVLNGIVLNNIQAETTLNGMSVDGDLVFNDVLTFSDVRIGVGSGLNIKWDFSNEVALKGQTIYLQALTTNSFTLEGFGEFFNPIYYQSSGFGIFDNLNSFLPILIDNSVSFDDNETITANNGATGKLIGSIKNKKFIRISGDWQNAVSIVGDLSGANASLTSVELKYVTVGEIVVYGGYRWENLTGEIGDSTSIFTLDEINWKKLPYTTNNYVKNYDKIKYDFLNDLIIHRSDVLGNEVDFDFRDVENFRYRINQINDTSIVFGSGRISSISTMQWGKNVNFFGSEIGTFNNKIINSYVELLNFRGNLNIGNVFKNSFYAKNIFDNESNMLFNSYDESRERNNYYGIYVNYVRNIFINSLIDGNVYDGMCDIRENKYIYTDNSDNYYMQYMEIKFNIYEANSSNYDNIYGISSKINHNYYGVDSKIDNNIYGDDNLIINNHYGFGHIISDSILPNNSSVQNENTILVDDLLSDDNGKALTARQGKVLDAKITKVNTIISSDDVNLDTLQKIVNSLKTTTTSLNNLLVNDLVTGGVTKALTAEQGRILQTQISVINTILNSNDVNLDSVQEIVDSIKNINISLSTILVNDLVTGGVTKALTAEQGKILKTLIDNISANGFVTNNRLANVATRTFKGRNTTGIGAVEDLTVIQVKSILAINNVSNTSDASKPVSTATTTQLNLRALLSGGNTFIGNQIFNNNIGIGAIPNFSFQVRRGNGGLYFTETNVVFNTLRSTTNNDSVGKDFVLSAHSSLSIYNIYLSSTGKTFFNKITDDGTDSILQVNGKISATEGTQQNQVIVRSQFDTKQDIANQIEVGASQQARLNWNGKTIIFNASCNIEIGNLLPESYNFNGITLEGVTVTLTIATGKTWLFGTPPTILGKQIFTVAQRGTTNSILVLGL